ncbi:MAG: protein-S-isoprenylcysteine O-methyltransferase Ste14 [Planctomycetota bacterium]|jgi:protein-S-isoprenylcysteine O-methyltransferase Ste14
MLTNTVTPYLATLPKRDLEMRMTKATQSTQAASSQHSMLSRILSLTYGVTTYALFLGTFLYLIGFLADFLVPKSINSGDVVSTTEALLVNGGFLGLFAVQHLIMARLSFKKHWTKIIPIQVERTTFVFVTCAILICMVWQWRPMPEVIWNVEGTGAVVLWALCGLGWGIVLLSTFLINHFDLFGLRQVVLHARNRAYEAPNFYERSLYKVVRHPLMLGFLIAFWFTPQMTVGHLFFAVMCTGYILVGLIVEERTLVAMHGDKYRSYRSRVRMLIPIPRSAS